LAAFAAKTEKTVAVVVGLVLVGDQRSVVVPNRAPRLIRASITAACCAQLDGFDLGSRSKTCRHPVRYEALDQVVEQRREKSHADAHAATSFAYALSVLGMAFAGLGKWLGGRREGPGGRKGQALQRAAAALGAVGAVLGADEPAPDGEQGADA